MINKIIENFETLRIDETNYFGISQSKRNAYDRANEMLDDCIEILKQTYENEIKLLVEENDFLKTWKQDIIEDFCKYDASSLDELVSNTRVSIMRKIYDRIISNAYEIDIQTPPYSEEIVSVADIKKEFIAIDGEYMANSLRAKISKLRHDGNITNEEYNELSKKLNGHDRHIKETSVREYANRVISRLSDIMYEKDISGVTNLINETTEEYLKECD